MLSVEELFQTPESIFIWFYLEDKEGGEKIDSLAIADFFIEIRISFKYIIQSILSTRGINFESIKSSDCPWQVLPNTIFILIRAWIR
jgi:hypothetical protein